MPRTRSPSSVITNAMFSTRNGHVDARAMKQKSQRGWNDRRLREEQPAGLAVQAGDSRSS